MQSSNSRIDEYIAKSVDFARPVLNHLRSLVHQAVPQIQESIKWSFIAFDYKGPFCTMAAFKQHAVFGFWKYSLLDQSLGYLQAPKTNGGDAMGNLGRICSLQDLPPDHILLAYLIQAKKLNDEGIKLPKRDSLKKKILELPPEVNQHFNVHPKAKENFHLLSPSHQNEYLEWIIEAKQIATRERRIAKMLLWLEEGKHRNWKYDRTKK